ncbi:hypothetical protein RRG08_059791 [Elysia crispata]|uniref:Uncharacterized protein n=1 Tax=Elysia crispata TaxID=231223 RepID=A0AAE1EEJ9_9GAST|nr:hypothetical protein RRG08_059791 [Elysia crispata]
MNSWSWRRSGSVTTYPKGGACPSRKHSEVADRDFSFLPNLPNTSLRNVYYRPFDREDFVRTFRREA